MTSEPTLDDWFPFVWLTPNSFDAHEDLDWPATNADLRVHWGVGEWMAGYVRVDAARAWQAFRDFLNGSVEQWQRKVIEAKRTKIIRRDAPEIIIDEDSL